MKPLLPGSSHQPFKDCAADAALTPFTDYGHAADMTVGQQPAGAYRFPFPVDCQHVHRYRIGVIPFQFFGHLLFDDEHPAPQILQRRAIGAP